MLELKVLTHMKTDRISVLPFLYFLDFGRLCIGQFLNHEWIHNKIEEALKIDCILKGSRQFQNIVLLNCKFDLFPVKIKLHNFLLGA